MTLDRICNSCNIYFYIEVKMYDQSSSENEENSSYNMQDHYYQSSNESDGSNDLNITFDISHCWPRDAGDSQWGGVVLEAVHVYVKGKVWLVSISV